MKKLSIVIAALLLAGTACERDGVYNPKKKISEIYDESSRSVVYQDYPEANYTYTNPKSLSSSWTWDKNLLTKITYDVDDYAEFKYNGKRLSTVILWDYGLTLTYVYNGSKIDKINVIMGWDGMTGTYAYTYKGNKVSQIDIIMNYVNDGYIDDDFKTKSFAKINQLALPAVVCDMLAQTENKMKQKSTKATTRTVTVDFEWSGDNVSKIKLIQKYEDLILFTATSTCTYDNKLNPFYHSPMFFGELFDTGSFSKNNLTKVVSTSKYAWEDEVETTETNYTYYYDGKFPVKQISESTEVWYSEYYGTTVTSKRNQVTYFVYK